MKKFLFVPLISILLSIALMGCAATCPPMFKNVKQNDLASGTANLFDQYPNRFYAIPIDDKTDIYVLLFRTSLLEDARTQEPIKALLSLGSFRDKPNCDRIQSKVEKKKLMEAERILGKAFYCFDSLMTEDEVIAQNLVLSSDSVNLPTFVDAHIGWYAATGDRRPVEKLVRNLAQNELACTCIPWPLTSISKEDTLFASFVREEASKYPESEKIRSLLGQIDPMP